MFPYISLPMRNVSQSLAAYPEISPTDSTSFLLQDTDKPLDSAQVGSLHSQRSVFILDIEWRPWVLPFACYTGRYPYCIVLLKILVGISLSGNIEQITSRIKQWNVSDLEKLHVRGMHIFDKRHYQIPKEPFGQMYFHAM